MSNTPKKDPFRKLLKWTAALLVLAALFATGFVLMDKYQKGEYARAVQRLNEENQAIIEDNMKQREEQLAKTQTGEVKVWPEAQKEGWDILDVSSFPVERGREQAVTRAELLKGGLLLVNRWHTMPGDFTLVEADIKSIGVSTNYRVPVDNANILLMDTAIPALDAMIADAKAAGLEFYTIREGYRNYNYQLGIWEKEIARHTDRSGDALIEKARERVAFPGTSDYHTGLSVSVDVYNSNDSVLNKMAFQETEQAKWLNEHCWEYGFVFRFPVQGYPDSATVDKSYKTGINLQIDAYRYVGKPHAAVMHQLDLSLEEYIEYLIAHPHIAVYENGILKYEIYRTLGGTADTTINLPAGAASYEASTDNMGGLVVAAIY